MGREQEIKVLLSRSEQERLVAAAGQTGLELSAFLRHAALIVAGGIQPRPYGKYELNSIYQEAASRGHLWEEEELRERGLPLFWSGTWVRARLAEGKAVNQLALLCGYPVTSVQAHLKNVHGIRLFRTLTDAEVAAIRERYAAGDSRRAIAADLGVSNVTVGKYLKGEPTEWEREAQARRIPEAPDPHVPPVKPNVQGLRDWSERLFAERVANLNWPTSTEQIARSLFDGNHSVARDWTGRMVRKGRLVRLTKGWFDLADQDAVPANLQQH